MGREAAFVVRSTWRVRHLDAMFISGSNQFLDNFGGALGFPYTLLKWSLMCRLMGCRVYIVSTGAGPLEQRLSHYMARAALRLCDYASFRDLGSMELIEQRVARGVGLLAPDLAHGLRVAQPAGRAAAAAARTLRVGINPMPIYDPRFWPQHDSDKYQRYVRQHALFALELQSRGHDVFFYSTHFPDADVALDIAAQMKQLSPADGEAPTIRMPATVPELMDLIVGTDVVVATRFHGILLALHAWRPVIGICYFRKSRDLMQRFGQDDSAIAVDDLDARGLLQRFDHLQANRASVFERIRREDLKLQDQLEHQFAELAARLRRMTG